MEQAGLRLMTPKDPITDAEFARLCLELEPHGPDAWLQVPWQVSLAQAVRAAVRENKLLANADHMWRYYRDWRSARDSK